MYRFICRRYSLSKTKNSFDPISIQEKDFNMANITEKLVADAKHPNPEVRQYTDKIVEDFHKPLPLGQCGH